MNDIDTPKTRMVFKQEGSFFPAGSAQSVKNIASIVSIMRVGLCVQRKTTECASVLQASSPRRPPTRFFQRLLALGVLTVSAFTWIQTEESEARRKKQPRSEPPLKIVSLTVSPDSYVAGDGSLSFNVEVALPPGTDGSTVLEVSTFITSRSTRHIRFLSIRQPTEPQEDTTPSPDSEADSPPSEGVETVASPPTESRRMQVTLNWDGTDHYRQVVPAGQYQYVIRAKLLAQIDDGVRTRMVSWKKKGRFGVLPPPVERPERPTGEHPPEESPPSDTTKGGKEKGDTSASK